MSTPGDPQKPRILIPQSAGHSHDEGEGNWLVSYADMMTLLVGFFVILNSFSKIDEEKFEIAKKEITKQFGGTYQIPYDVVSERLKEAIKKMGLGEQFVIKTTDLGVEISFLGTVFFSTGSADLKPQGRELLTSLIPIIKSESTDFDVTVEGHTDDVPISFGLQFKNNFELSSIRACRVLDSFLTSGFVKSRLTAVGYGETRPVIKNRDANGVSIPENQAKNRRVVIKLLKHAQPTVGQDSKTDSPSAPPPAGTDEALESPPSVNEAQAAVD